jgi:molybdopterin molybdotransferase
MMLTVEEAQQKILALTPQLDAQSVSLVDAIGRVLATDIESDIDSPPYDKSLMDGFALSTSSFAGQGTRLQVIETITAGELPQHDVGPGEAARIMTGAVLPKGADAVVMFEQTESAADTVEIQADSVAAEQNILRRGTVMRSGEVVLQAGRALGPMDIGLLGEVGRDPVNVSRRVEVAVLATGNELVDVRQVPAAGTIRNSNGPMVASQVTSQGAIVRNLGIGRDDETELRQLIAKGLECDILVLSGGVSAGDLDLVPKVLSVLGVKKAFHGVKVKPGKPLWVGHHQSVGQRDKPHTTLVFGLPGNPVSSLVCFHLFVIPALRKMNGQRSVLATRFVGRLQHQWTHPGGRTTFFPGIVRRVGDDLAVQLCPWKGSADQRSLVDANVLVVFPDKRTVYESGSTVEFEWIRAVDDVEKG